MYKFKSRGQALVPQGPPSGPRAAIGRRRISAVSEVVWERHLAAGGEEGGEGENTRAVLSGGSLALALPSFHTFSFFRIFGKNGEFAARLDPRAPRGGWRSGGGARAGSEGAVAPPTIADLASFSGTERDVRKMSDLLQSRHRRVLLRSGRGPALGRHPGASRALDD